MVQVFPITRPRWWPHFSSPLRSTAVTARLGRALGIAIGVCFVTGLLSHYQYHPLVAFPQPATPAWGYRLTQGIHITTGTATIPLLLVKMWSVYPNLFRFPPVKSIKHGIERASVALLVASALVQLVTGYMNTMDWYIFPWFFTTVHFALGWVLIGSILLHVGIKLPDIVYGLQAKVSDADVLTEIPWDENPVSHSNAGDVPAPPTPAISRRGVLTATGVGIGAVVLTTVSQTATPLEPIGLFAIRQKSKGPQGVPVNKTAEQARVMEAAMAPGWDLQVEGPRPYSVTLADLDGLATHEARLPVNCVEGWSANARWRGLSLLEVVERAGGTAKSRVRVHSLETDGYNNSEVFGPQVSKALLATHLNGQRIDINHGYPLRLIAPDRAGVLQTKWLTRIEVL